jgi:hypothetical protein
MGMENEIVRHYPYFHFKILLVVMLILILNDLFPMYGGWLHACAGSCSVGPVARGNHPQEPRREYPATAGRRSRPNSERVSIWACDDSR